MLPSSQNVKFFCQNHRVVELAKLVSECRLQFCNWFPFWIWSLRNKIAIYCNCPIQVPTGTLKGSETKTQPSFHIGILLDLSSKSDCLRRFAIENSVFFCPSWLLKPSCMWCTSVPQMTPPVKHIQWMWWKYIHSRNDPGVYVTTMSFVGKQSVYLIWLSLLIRLVYIWQCYNVDFHSHLIDFRSWPRCCRANCKAWPSCSKRSGRHPWSSIQTQT